MLILALNLNSACYISNFHTCTTLLNFSMKGRMHDYNETTFDVLL